MIGTLHQGAPLDETVEPVAGEMVAREMVTRELVPKDSLHIAGKMEMVL